MDKLCEDKKELTGRLARSEVPSTSDMKDAVKKPIGAENKLKRVASKKFQIDLQQDVIFTAWTTPRFISGWPPTVEAMAKMMRAMADALVEVQTKRSL